MLTVLFAETWRDELPKLTGHINEGDIIVVQDDAMMEEVRAAIVDNGWFPEVPSFSMYTYHAVERNLNIVQAQRRQAAIARLSDMDFEDKGG